MFLRSIGLTELLWPLLRREGRKNWLRLYTTYSQTLIVAGNKKSGVLHQLPQNKISACIRWVRDWYIFSEEPTQTFLNWSVCKYVYRECSLAFFRSLHWPSFSDTNSYLYSLQMVSEGSEALLTVLCIRSRLNFKKPLWKSTHFLLQSCFCMNSASICHFLFADHS